MTILDDIAQDPQTQAATAAAPAAIVALEKRLGRDLPRAYRDFLCRFNGGEFRFARMLSVAELADQESTDNDLFAIGDDYSGEAYCLDFRDAGGDCDDPPVVLKYGYGDIKAIAPSFSAFLESAYDPVLQPREVEARIPRFRSLAPVARIDLPLLAKQGLALHLLSPDVLDAKYDPNPSSFEQPPVPRASHTVALSIYEPDSGASDRVGCGKPIDLGYNGIAVLDVSDRPLTQVGAGSRPRKLLGPYSLQTVLHVECAERIPADAVLLLRFTVIGE
jgi:SMI1 / KNR4 family (SUKH-1)